MKPIDFPQSNVRWAENQAEYQTLPAFSNDEETISCWRLTIWERLKLLWTGCIWVRQINLTAPLQPQLPQIESPFE